MVVVDVHFTHVLITRFFNMTDIDQTDPNSRIALLEQNLRSMQEQHQIIVGDLHKEIDRLQEENKGNNDTEVSRECKFM